MTTSTVRQPLVGLGAATKPRVVDDLACLAQGRATAIEGIVGIAAGVFLAVRPGEGAIAIVSVRGVYGSCSASPFWSSAPDFAGYGAKLTR
jgi:hypothetical protein